MSQFVEDGWHGGSTASDAPTVDDTGKSGSSSSSASTAGVYGELTDALIKALRDNPTAATAAKGEETKANVESGESGKGVITPELSSDAASAFGDLDMEKLQELVNKLVSSQNEINTITQVISTAEKIYETGKENYESAEKKMPEAEKQVTDSQKAWEEAKGMMGDLQRAQDAVTAAENKLLEARTEAERQKAQKELDEERAKWQALLDKALTYSEKEIEAARKLGDKTLEKQWTEQHDLMSREGDAVNKSLDSLSENMNKYINDLNSDGSRKEEYLTAAKLNDAQYQEAAAALKKTLEDVKSLQSALVAYARKVLEETQKLLDLASSDLSMSLDQAKKAFDMAKLAKETADRIYEDAKGTPYEEQAKILADTAKKLADDAYDNYQKIRDYYQKKNLSSCDDDEFADQRLKDAEDYAKSLGYLYSVNWRVDKGDKIIDSFNDLATLGVKEDTYYKAVGKTDGNTLFLGEDVRFYKVEKKDVFCSSAAESILLGRTEDSAGNYNFAGRRCYVTAEVYGDLVYYIVEVNGGMYVQGIKYANCYLKNHKVTEQQCYGGRCQSEEYGGIYGAARRVYPDSAFVSQLNSQWGGLQPNGSFSDSFSMKIFSKSFLGY